MAIINRVINSEFLDEQLFTKDGPVTIVRAGKDTAAATADSIIVAAVPGKKIRVIYMYMTGVAADTTATMRSKPAGAGSDLGRPYHLYFAKEPYITPQVCYLGYHETNEGEALAISTGAGGPVNVNVICLLV